MTGNSYSLLDQTSVYLRYAPVRYAPVRYAPVLPLSCRAPAPVLYPRYANCYSPALKLKPWENKNFCRYSCYLQYIQSPTP